VELEAAAQTKRIRAGVVRDCPALRKIGHDRAVVIDARQSGEQEGDQVTIDLIEVGEERVNGQRIAHHALGIGATRNR